MTMMHTLLEWLTSTHYGMLVLGSCTGMIAVFCLRGLAHFLKALVRPNIEHAFYEKILHRWLGGYFLRHRIVATFIRMHRMGDVIVNSLVVTVATFVVVALLSACLTATVIHIHQHAFIYSPLLLGLATADIMLAWALARNLLYFRKVLYRLP